MAAAASRLVTAALNFLLSAASLAATAAAISGGTVKAGQAALGWNAKALDALGDQTKPEDIRSIGFAINEWLAASASRNYPAFVQGMLGGGDKLDEVIQGVLGGNREEFLGYSGQWVARYGAGR